MLKMKMGETKDIPLSQLTIGTFQARTSGVKKGIDELAESIKKVGLLEAISVHQSNDGKYQIVAGQRRFLACESLGMESIRATILEGEIDETIAKTISLTENMMRESMPQKDLINVCTYLYNKYGNMTIVSEETGLPYGKVREYVKFVRLTKELQKMVEGGDIKLPVAIRALDGATDQNGEVNEADAMKLAKEMSELSGDQQRSIVKARRKKPQAPVDSLIEEAKSGKRQQYEVELGPTEADALDQYAQSEKTTQNDAASFLVEEGLKEKGFLNPGE